MSNKPKKTSKLTKITKAPIKILSKARDIYVQSMLGFSGNVKTTYGSVGVGRGATRLPKSFSVHSSREVNEEELRRLLRLSSTRESEKESLNMDYCNGMKRSYSVGLGKIGTIDEDRACSFREEVDVNNLYPRSRSHAVRQNIVYH